MNKEETKKILSILKSNYPNSYNRMTEFDAKMMVETWLDIFEEIPYKIMLATIKEYMVSNTSKFSPTIGELQLILHNRVSSINNKNADESFEKIMKLINKYGTHYKSDYDKAYLEFDDIEKQLINYQHYRNLGQDTDPKGVRRKSYRERYNMIKESITKQEKLELGNNELLKLE